jgi:hypothetical protein
MDLLTAVHARARRRWVVMRIMLAAALIAAVAPPASSRSDPALDVNVKAAFLFNFVKFTEWPPLPGRISILVCVVGNDGIAAAFVDTVRGQSINGRRLDVWRPDAVESWPLCQLLFIADAEMHGAASGLEDVRTLPVLTVSDSRGFARSAGIIELYLEGGRMRFAINVDGISRSGLRVSSRLLGLARVVRDGDVR